MTRNQTVAAFLLGSALVTSCATMRTNKTGHDAPLLPGMNAKIPASGESSVSPASPVSPEEVSGEMLVIDENAKDEGDTDETLDDETGAETGTADAVKPAPTPKKDKVPFEFNQKVADWIQYFSQKDRERFQRFLDRGEPYREVIENILEENQVPADLYYLGMIESGFSTRAKSSAKAVGVWQFMRATGHMYGLSADQYIDERRDPIRATEAAAKMLRDLYRDFHSWPLAMAAYNAGPGRIRSAIRRGHSHDFWELAERRVLPRETIDYVPKFLAARYIGENPDLFAFYLNEEKKYPNVELVSVPSAVPFESIEKSCGMPDGTLSFVNPQYLKSFTHPGHKLDEIWVPEDYQKAVESKSAELAVYKIKVKAEVSRARPVRNRVPVYSVKRGDTLKSIARKRGLSVAYLKQVNGLKSSRVTAGQQLKLAASSYRQKRVHPRKHKKRRNR